MRSRPLRVDVPAGGESADQMEITEEERNLLSAER